MKLSVKFTLLTATVLISSLASGNENLTISVAQHQIVTPKEQVRVKHRRIVKSKVQRVQPFGIDDTDDDIVQNDDFATGYRRRDLTRIKHEDGISEHVRWRLFLARQLAMMKYREINGYPIDS
jgi:hypothetical protein